MESRIYPFSVFLGSASLGHRRVILRHLAQLTVLQVAEGPEFYYSKY